MDTLHFFSPEAFERWDWRSPDNPGIGGSETAHIEMAWRMARRGYRVVSYTPMRTDIPAAPDWKGVEWRDVSEADFSSPGLWILSRCPQRLDEFAGNRNDQQSWLICQDEDYPHKWTDERLAKLDKCVALCPDQARQFHDRYPQLRGKIGLSSNGLKPEVIEAVLAEKHERNPKRIMYASSPDRALVPALQIFARVREFVPDAEFHVCYGFDNIDKLVAVRQSDSPEDRYFRAYIKDLKALIKQPGVVWRGRMGQAELCREWAKTGIWLYPCSMFRETSCITCMEVQALGAVPVYSPLWAVGQNTQYGVAIEGFHTDSLVQARFASSCVALMQDPEKQDAIRADMMPWARRHFTYERFCDQWESWIHGYEGRSSVEQQHAFHLRHANGRVINIGANDDAAGLGFRGVNVDVMKGIDPWTGRELATDITADARNLPTCLYGNFGTAALSDVLEHFDDADAIKVLQNARLCLKAGGRITITCPEDHRKPEEQHAATKQSEPQARYTDGVWSYHWRPCTKEIMERWFQKADLQAEFYRPIDYGFTWGHGFVVKPKGE